MFICVCVGKWNNINAQFKFHWLIKLNGVLFFFDAYTETRTTQFKYNSLYKEIYFIILFTANDQYMKDIALYSNYNSGV